MHEMSKRTVGTASVSRMCSNGTAGMVVARTLAHELFCLAGGALGQHYSRSLALFSRVFLSNSRRRTPHGTHKLQCVQCTIHTVDTISRYYSTH